MTERYLDGRGRSHYDAWSTAGLVFAEIFGNEIAFKCESVEDAVVKLLPCIDVAI